jgi:eukaryotic-like serine/threonine-protein kinase
MTNERWPQLDQLFLDALECPPEGRAEFVARACGADEALRSETLSLLAAANASGEFLAAPALDLLARTMSAAGWSLRPGERIGAYTVVQLLGAGGSGEVWRAKDERLDRDVAIKILLPHFSDDAERLRRFAEEARTAGALNHSNILAVYDVGEHHGTPFLVSECLEGESLRKRLASRPLPLDEALAVALGIARGLAAAHARGIIHRDLKPDNVFLRSDGGVKILDFGLAKLQLPVDRLHGAGSHTMTGVIVGTAGYMAPEQVRGEHVDARSDLFALGATLYEMLGGQRAFNGESTIETLHAILTTDPLDLSRVNRQVPQALATIVTRLLKKSPEARFQSAADLAWALERVEPDAYDRGGRQPQSGTSRAAERLRWGRSVAGTALATTLLVAGWWLLSTATREPRDTELVQFTWSLPSGLVLDSPPVVSPDGRHIAFVGTDASGPRLFVRDLASVGATTVPGTEGAKQPFWSPDGKLLGFFARRKLMKVVVAGGAPVEIADAIDGRGAAWSSSGVIVFAPDLNVSSLAKVSADGGRAEAATLLNRSQGENSHRWPVFLPDGVHFLYFVRSSIDKRRGVYVGRVDRPASQSDAQLFQSESEAVYVPPSSELDASALLYVRDSRIELRSFDVARLAVGGDVRTLGLQAGQPTTYHASMLSASARVLAFASSSVPFGMRLGSVDRRGPDVQFQRDSEAQNWPRLSPDGQRLARQRIDVVAGNPDIWVEDLTRGTRVRVTTDADPDIFPVWSPRQNRLAYASGNSPGRAGQGKLVIASADGTGVLRTFPCPAHAANYCEPTDWSPDDQRLIVNVRDVRGGDVWSVETENGTAEPLLAEMYTERDARVSPDGRWIAYVSEELGRAEVSVRNIGGPPTRIVISGSGGDQPVWRRDGAELFFVDPHGRLRSVSVRERADGRATFGVPIDLQVPPVGFGHWGTQYDVSPDGGRVYFMRRNEDPPPREVTVVIGWRALLR